MPIEKQKFLWSDGKMVPWDEARVHVSCWSLHYGVGVFEGLRAYEGDKNSYVVRLEDHVDRLLNSAKIYMINVPYSKQQLMQGTIDSVKSNNLKSCYIRPIVFLDAMVELGLNPGATPVRAAIYAIPFGRYLGADALEKGIRCGTSSWRRNAPYIMPTEAKCCGNYANSYLAKQEALRNGYAEAIMLDPRGYVSEGSAENIFVVKDGAISTPPVSASILKGITRDCVMKIAKSEKLELVERDINRAELYTADEVFFSGTGGELTPITEIDQRKVGSGVRGPVCKRMQDVYFGAVTGKDKKYKGWVTQVY